MVVFENTDKEISKLIKENQIIFPFLAVIYGVLPVLIDYIKTGFPIIWFFTYSDIIRTSVNTFAILSFLTILLFANFSILKLFSEKKLEDIKEYWGWLWLISSITLIYILSKFEVSFKGVWGFFYFAPLFIGIPISFSLLISNNKTKIFLFLNLYFISFFVGNSFANFEAGDLTSKYYQIHHNECLNRNILYVLENYTILSDEKTDTIEVIRTAEIKKFSFSSPFSEPRPVLNCFESVKKHEAGDSK